MTKNIQKKNAPETLIQPNEISRAIYSLNPYGRKLLAMAMALMSPDDDEYSVIFSANDFLQSLGIPRGGETEKYLKAAIRDVAKSFVEIERPDRMWEVYPWLHKGKLSMADKTDHEGWIVYFNFNPELGETIKAFKKGYSKISLVELGKLQSRYAIRFYELAISYAGFAGQEGNRRGEWYFDMSLDDIRIRFQIDHKKYKTTGEFRRNIIDNPIEEINAARIGLRIEPEYVRRGKRLAGARFHCQWEKRGEPKKTNPSTETGQEEEKLKAAFPEEFEELKKAELTRRRKQPGLFKDNPEREELAAESAALQLLREAHPDFFKRKKSR